MIKKFFKSRGVRKFLRSKMAIASLGVISVYALVALVVFAGAISLDDVTNRVGVERMPGFLQQPSRELRLQAVDLRLKAMESVARRGADSTPEEQRRMLNELSLFERQVPDEMLFDEYSTLVVSARQAYDNTGDAQLEVEDLADELVAISEELHEMKSEGASAEDISALKDEQKQMQVELASIMPELDSLIDIVEAKMLQIQPIPKGMSGTIYKLRLSLGTDAKGASIAMKGLYSVKIAFQIGLIVSLISVFLGSFLGAAAAFYGGWVDNAVMWLVSTLSSIPYLVLMAVLIVAFRGTIFDDAQKPGLALVPVYTAFCLTFWIGTCRVVRGEVMKIKELEYVQAATSIGFGKSYILIKHIIPNTLHIMFINFSLGFIGAIKSEVILSFLGLGVKGQPSWGIMIAHAKDDVSSFFFWEVLTATLFMFGLVLAFNIVSDALQDAFDPKHV